jgi:antitoxin MazE
MTATISSWGNSQGLRFPKNIMEELHLAVGDKIELVVKNQEIILKPLKTQRHKYDINALVNKIPADYKVKEELTNKTGLEEW